MYLPYVVGAKLFKRFVDNHLFFYSWISRNY